MADFVESSDNLQSSSLSFVEMDPSLELMSQRAELNSSQIGYSNQTFLSYETSKFLMPSTCDVPGLSATECSRLLSMSQAIGSNKMQNDGVRKRKSMEVPNTSSRDHSEAGLKDSIESGKRGRTQWKEVDKEQEVVHVRARRGQATDSHSLAERVRREKINEKMVCLRGLVPGCYKAMGMARMLDEIINYVQSLQNQIEFLSMKLSAASSFYDFNSDMETILTTQLHNTNEAGEIERFVSERYGASSSFHSTMPY